jgi:hypothetical protein
MTCPICPATIVLTQLSGPGRLVRAVLFFQLPAQEPCPQLPYSAVMSWRSTALYSVQVGLSGQPVQTDVPRLSPPPPSCSVPYVRSKLSWLSRPGCLLLAVFSQLSRPICPVSVLFLWSYSRFSISSILSWVSHPHCPVLAVLSYCSCSVLASILALLS